MNTDLNTNVNPDTNTDINSKADFDKIIDRKNTYCKKWDKYKGKDIIPFWIADSDFETTPAIVEALHQRVAQGVFGYTEQGTAGVREAITSHLSYHYDWSIKSEWIVPLSSLVNGLTFSSLLAGDEGDEIMVPEIIYPPFNFVINNTKRERIRVPMQLQNERWTLDFAALEASITPKTKMVLFCNPHNPGGTVYTEEELLRLQAICKKHDLLICSDEIHCDLILDKNKKHYPFGNLNEDAANRCITLMAATKTYNLAGMNFGFAIIPNDEIRKKFEQDVLEKAPEVSILGQTATEAAFKHGESWRLQQIDYLRDNHDYLLREINAIPGLKMFPLEATYLAWIDVSDLALDNAESFFENAGIGISAGVYFGDKNFIRLNFACRRSLLEEAIKRITKAVSEL
ncbi:PatB family C-S lyase [Cocleimonas sp. KMM 6892]|uniref:MalY/PatB family protein n=1 Tax=unclassified Cocleimonas TaxID=2639732 RepID=UPI002DB655BC|nr:MULTISPECIES: PatB family C-S lyase [unclassified Cocleimonas]MEB8433597.1 PatB family C-S lyase [Cocleimonas sp. KMM 6892]MEC4716408.1 PatB family C-S lyase [Cocleimonas sp. KMM 6895]MEC4745699.1 PatB family C-S lyase [Cocleimonas sp. KMM 6896]